MSKQEYEDLQKEIISIDELYAIADKDLRENDAIAKCVGYNNQMLMDWFKEHGYQFIKIQLKDV